MTDTWILRAKQSKNMDCNFDVLNEYQLFLRQLLEEKSSLNRQLYFARWKNYNKSPDLRVVFAVRDTNIIHKRSVVPFGRVLPSRADVIPASECSVFSQRKIGPSSLILLKAGGWGGKEICTEGASDS